MNTGYLILDCFVDEPACLGVPPFVAPYPRYIYGALTASGIPPERITYKTIDYLRERDYRLEGDYSIVFLIGGAVVPGKYLGYKIGTLAEIRSIIGYNPRIPFAVGGLVSHALKEDYSPNATFLLCDIEKYASNFVKGNLRDEFRTIRDIQEWSVLGSDVVLQHPDYPQIICEIETYRGCPRQQHCSFCSESLQHTLDFREQNHILDEIKSLCLQGIKRFRLGRQADILQYKTEYKEFRNGFPRPSVNETGSLFASLKSLREVYAIDIFIDNANPGTILNFPEDSETILKSIADTITPGDTLALGVESLDPNVVLRNNLKIHQADLITVIDIVNRLGGRRVDGITQLLPGINLIHGLPGESRNTFKINYEGLLAIAERGLLLKRINIRKILPFPGTKAFMEKHVINEHLKNRYEYYKNKIRHDIDGPMLKRVFPVGLILRNLRVEDQRYEYSYARQLASYPITCIIPEKLPLKSFLDVLVVGHRERSLIALPYPIHINQLSQKSLEAIPGVSRGLAREIIHQRPFPDRGTLLMLMQNINPVMTAHLDL